MKHQNYLRDYELISWICFSPTNDQAVDLQEFVLIFLRLSDSFSKVLSLVWFMIVSIGL